MLNGLFLFGALECFDLILSGGSTSRNSAGGFILYIGYGEVTNALVYGLAQGEAFLLLVGEFFGGILGGFYLVLGKLRTYAESAGGGFSAVGLAFLLGFFVVFGELGLGFFVGLAHLLETFVEVVGYFGPAKQVAKVFGYLAPAQGAQAFDGIAQTAGKPPQRSAYPPYYFVEILEKLDYGLHCFAQHSKGGAHSLGNGLNNAQVAYKPYHIARGIYNAHCKVAQKFDNPGKNPKSSPQHLKRHRGYAAKHLKGGLHTCHCSLHESALSYKIFNFFDKRLDKPQKL